MNLSSSNNSGDIKYDWNFGDGNTHNTQNPSHNYAAYGNKSVKLVVASNLGCKDSISKTVSVFEKPSINFSTTIDVVANQKIYIQSFKFAGNGTVTSPAGGVEFIVIRRK